MTKESTINPLKDQIKQWAHPMGTFNEALWNLVKTEMEARKLYALQFEKTGDQHLLTAIDICNNNIKKLLAL
jgi:hypothetical protein